MKVSERRRAGLAFSPGHLVVTEFSRVGGVRTKSEKVTDDEGKVSIVSRHVADDPELIEQAKSLINRANYIVNLHCVRTPLGWFTDEKGLKQLRADLDELSEAPEMFRKVADGRSESRIRLDYFPIRVDEIDDRTAKRFAGAIVECLAELKMALRSGKRGLWFTAWEKSKNLDLPVRGEQKNHIRFAVEYARMQRKAVEQMKKIKSMSDEEAGAKLDLAPIEEVETMFKNL